MPIYEYKCKKCGETFEAIQRFSDPELTQCQVCGKKGSVTKLISAAAFHLKGTGWYVTDFRDKGKKPAGKPEGESKGDSASASGSESSSSSSEKSEKSGKSEKSEKPEKGKKDAGAKSGSGSKPSGSASAAAD
jgi:putative FmdB family regulatory protein